MGNDKGMVKSIAEERINTLLDISECFFKGKKPEGVDESLAKKYISLALQIRRHYKIRNKDKRLGFLCKKCHVMLVPGMTCTIRVIGKEGKIIYKCNKCSTEKTMYFSNKNMHAPTK